MIESRQAQMLLLVSTAFGFAVTMLPESVHAQAPADQPSVQNDLNAAIRKNLFNSKQGGVGTGGLQLFPELYAGLSYDDNIYSTRTNTISDTLLTISPSLFAKIGKGANLLTMTSGMDIARFGDHATENYTDGWLGLQGKLRPIQNTNVFGGFGVDYTHEPRGTQDAFIGKYPTRYRDTHFNLGASQKIGRWELRIAGTSSDKNFDNIENDLGWINDLRDREETSVGGRLGYALNNQYGLYLQGIRDVRSYRHSLDNYGYDRNSSGYRMIAGLDFKPVRSVVGDVFAGKLYQQYVEGHFDAINKPDFGLNVKWSPCAIYNVTGFVRRNLYETTLPGTPGDVYTSGGVSVKKWASERLRLRTDLTVAQADYPQINRTDSIVAGGLGADYRLSGKTFLEFDYAIVARNSNLTNQNTQYYADYADSEVSLGIRRVFYPVPVLPLAISRPIPKVSAKGLAGWYGGIQYGYGATDTETSGGRGSHGIDNGNLGSDGGSGGVFGGYGWVHDRWYYGLELDVNDSSAKWYHQKTKTGGREFSLAQHESYGGGLRLGHVMPNGALPYIRAGVEQTKFVTDYDVSGYPSTSIKNSLSGADYGVGLDLPVSRHIFARLGYNYTVYPNYDVSYSDGTVQQTETFHNTQSVFRVGVGLRADAQSVPAYRPRINGFYAGIQLGDGDLSTRLSADQTDSGPIYSHLNSDFGKSGFTSGVFLGYGRLTWRHLYAGIEAGVNDSHTGWQHARTPTGRVFSVDMNASAYSDIKLGYLMRNGSLLYVGGGISRTRFNTQYKKGQNQNAWIDADEIKTGALMNVGCRVPVNQDMFVRFEYNYDIYPDYSFTTTQANADTVSFKNQLSIFTIGLGWMI